MSALCYSNTSGFEVIHGLLDRVMELLEVPPCEAGSADGYYIKSTPIFCENEFNPFFQRDHRRRTSKFAQIFIYGTRKLDKWVLFIQILWRRLIFPILSVLLRLISSHSCRMRRDNFLDFCKVITVFCPFCPWLVNIFWRYCNLSLYFDLGNTQC